MITRGRASRRAHWIIYAFPYSLAVLDPGRLCSVACTNRPALRDPDSYSGTDGIGRSKCLLGGSRSKQSQHVTRNAHGVAGAGESAAFWPADALNLADFATEPDPFPPFS